VHQVAGFTFEDVPESQVQRAVFVHEKPGFAALAHIFGHHRNGAEGVALRAGEVQRAPRFSCSQ
jgi:hypothetical protein